jgi:hypothetical protein
MLNKLIHCPKLTSYNQSGKGRRKFVKIKYLKHNQLYIYIFLNHVVNILGKNKYTTQQRPKLSTILIHTFK